MAARVVLAALEVPGIAKFLPEALANNVKARLTAIFKPKAAQSSKAPPAPTSEPASPEEDAMKAMEEAVAAEEAEGAPAAEGASDAASEEAAETMTPEEAEAARVAAEEFAKKAAELEAAEEAAREKERLEREAAEREAAAKAAEERERFRKQMEAEKAAKEAKEKAEREAKAKAKAEAEAAAEAARVAAAKAQAELDAAAPANAGREAALTSAIASVQEGLEFPYQVLSLGTAAAGEASAITAAIGDLEANYAPLSAETVAEGLVGFWKILITDDDKKADDGMTGYGKSYNPYGSVLAHYQSFTKNLPGSVLPTIQTVEVLSDTGMTGTVTCEVAALKGDFEVEAGEPVGVVEGYRWIERAGAKQFDVTPAPSKWQCTYLSPTLRICRGDGGKLSVYAKADAGTCTGEIAEFVSNPPDPNNPAGEGEGEEGEEGAGAVDDEDDDRPLWQKRLDAEKNSGTLDDDSGSSIP